MLTLRVLGTAAIEGSGGPVAGRAAQGRRLALLAVLAAARGRVISRDKLIALLWPEATPDRARPQLSDTLYILRSALGEDVVRSAGDGLTLNASALTSDVDGFERAVEEGRHAEAIELYGGPLLDGFHLTDAATFEDWLDTERARLAQLYAAALQTLAERCDADRPGDAVGWWRRLAVHDPYNGRVALGLMRALHATGDRAGALQHARIHAALLREEFDAEPDAEVGALAEQLRQEAGTRAAVPSTTTAVPAVSVAQPALASEPASAASAPAPQPPITVPSPTGRSALPLRKMLRRAVLPAAAILVVLAVGVLYGKRGAESAGATPAARSVGVLPFVNMSPDEENTYFSDGLSEQIITALSGIEGLRVAARTSSFALRDRALNVRAIGDTLGVDAVLEGSVRTDGRRLRITAQLIDAETGYHIWTDQYDSELADVVTVQDRIAGAIAGALELRLTSRTAAPAERPPSLEAYDFYLRGLHLRNSLSADALRRAAELFDRAIALEPDFALAWAAKATVIAPLIYFGLVPQAESVEELRVLTARALELDPSLGEAHAALGIIKLFFEWDWAGAERELRRAIELNPNDAHAWHHLANYYHMMGRPADAVAARTRSLELDPLNARTHYTLAGDCAAAGNVACAAEHARRAGQLDPLHPLALGLGPSLPSGLAELHILQGRYEEAVEEHARIATLRGATTAEVDALHSAYADGGIAGFWRAWAEVDTRLSNGAPDPLRMAAIRALAGDTAAAMQWLERAWAGHNPGLIYLATDPAFESVRRSPRVAQILAEMGLTSPVRTRTSASARTEVDPHR